MVLQLHNLDVSEDAATVEKYEMLGLDGSGSQLTPIGPGSKS